MSKHENKLGALLAKVLRKQGAKVYANVASEHNETGWPDKHVWSRPWVGLIEVKGARTATTEVQRRMLRDLDHIWPRHAVQVRFDTDVGNDPTVRVTWYSYDGDQDVFECRLSELLGRLRDWAKKEEEAT